MPQNTGLGTAGPGQIPRWQDSQVGSQSRKDSKALKREILPSFGERVLRRRCCWATGWILSSWMVLAAVR